MKEKIIPFIIAILFCFCTYGQNKYENLSKSQIIDTIRSEFWNDTIKKNEKSKLIVIDGIYIFKPDILEPKSLMEFLDDVFVESKIKEIGVIDSEQAATVHFEGDARHGVVAINLEDGVSLSLNTLGFAFDEKILLPQTSIKIDCLELQNLYQIDTEIFRSEQPDSRAFANLEKYGITEVLNLRYWHSDDQEAKSTQLILHRVPMRAENIKDSDVIEALKIIKNRKGNILIHCKHGSDRTGLMVAMYRMVFQNWTKEQAIAELTKEHFGFHSIFSNIITYIRNVDVEKMKKHLID